MDTELEFEEGGDSTKHENHLVGIVKKHGQYFQTKETNHHEIATIHPFTGHSVSIGVDSLSYWHSACGHLYPFSL